MLSRRSISHHTISAKSGGILPSHCKSEINLLDPNIIHTAARNPFGQIIHVIIITMIYSAFYCKYQPDLLRIVAENIQFPVSLFSAKWCSTSPRHHTQLTFVRLRNRAMAVIAHLLTKQNSPRLSNLGRDDGDVRKASQVSFSHPGQASDLCVIILLKINNVIGP